MTNFKKYAAVAALALALTACGNNTEEAAPADNAATTEAPVEENVSTETTTDAVSTDDAVSTPSTDVVSEEGSN